MVLIPRVKWSTKQIMMKYSNGDKFYASAAYIIREQTILIMNNLAFGDKIYCLTHELIHHLIRRCMYKYRSEVWAYLEWGWEILDFYLCLKEYDMVERERLIRGRIESIKKRFILTRSLL